MRYVFPFWATLVVCVVGLAADQQKKVVFSDPPKGLIVVDQANNWEALCKKAKPTFTWGKYNMMWVEGEGDQPRVRLNQAYKSGDGIRIYKIGPDFGKIGARPGEAFVETMPKWEARKPRHDGGSGNYITEIAGDAKRGTVYEIGWQHPFNQGSGLWTEERRIYLLRLPNKNWRLLGEGPGEGGGKTGRGVGHGFSTKVSVRFDVPNVPCRVVFVSTVGDHEWLCEGDGDRVLREDLRAHRRSHLDGKVTELRYESKLKYVTVGDKDSFDRIVTRIATWKGNWKFAGKAERAEILAFIAKKTLELNPKVYPEKLKTGDEIFVANYYNLETIRKKYSKLK